MILLNSSKIFLAKYIVIRNEPMNVAFMKLVGLAESFNKLNYNAGGLSQAMNKKIDAFINIEVSDVKHADTLEELYPNVIVPTENPKFTNETLELLYQFCKDEDQRRDIANEYERIRCSGNAMLRNIFSLRALFTLIFLALASYILREFIRISARFVSTHMKKAWQLFGIGVVLVIASSWNYFRKTNHGLYGQR